MKPPVSSYSGIPAFNLAGSAAGAFSRLFTFKPLVYGYANARVHGLYSTFAESSQINEMISCRSVQALIEILERTSYKNELVPLSLKFKGEELVELALGRNFANFTKKALVFTPESGKKIVEAILTRWDAHNVKLVILARKQKKTYEQIAPYLVLAASLNDENLKGILEAQSSEEFYERLRATNFGAGLARMPSTYTNGSIRAMFLSMGRDDAALEPLLAVLDVYAYSLIEKVSANPDEDSKEVIPFLSSMVDEKNLSTSLRLLGAKTQDSSLKNYFVPGGTISARQWLRLMRTGERSQIFEKLSHRLSLSQAIPEYEKSGKISSLEVVLSQESAHRGIKMFRHAQMSIGAIVGAILLKEQEVSNIRKIVRAKSLGLKEDEIKKMMVTVN